MPKMNAVPRSKQIQKTQKAFNAYIRKRDQDKGCISCHTYKIEHASHYFAAGKYTALRFHEDNVHGSCLRCNYFMHGNLVNYRKNLIGRIGKDRLELLEGLALRIVKKWSTLELQEIEKEYKTKIKNL